MKLLDRYIFKQFFTNFLLVLGSLVTIYLLVDFFERIDNFSAAGKSLGFTAKYFLFKIPLIYDQLSPVCILLAGIITIGLLNRNLELMTLNAGGISLFRICLPIFFAALVSTMMTVAVAQWILPYANTVTNNIWYEQVTHKISKGIIRNGRIFYQGEKGIYTFKQPEPSRYSFTEFSYTAWDADHNVDTYLTADEASWREDWFFRNGQLKTAEGTNYAIKIFSELAYSLPDPADAFFVPAYHIKELSLFNLHKNAVRSLKTGEKQAIIDINNRFSFIFLGLPLVILALPALLFLNRKWRVDLSIALPMSSALAFCAWGAWSASQSLSQFAYINSFAASWSIHVLLTATGLFWLWRMNR